MKALELEVTGLDCAHCASKLQDKIEEIPCVEEAQVDFLNQKIKLTYTHPNENHVKEQIETAANFHNCSLVAAGERPVGLTRSLKFRLLRYTAGFFLFGLNMLPMFENTYLLALLSFGIFGYDVLWNSVKSLFKGDFFTENTLMAIAVAAALLTGMIEEAVLVMAFFQIGEFFQEMAVDKSRKSIAGLMNIKADYATKLMDDKQVRIDPKEAAIGDVLLVKPGEKVPLDGIVLEGSSQIDLSSLHGESVPRTVRASEELLSGTVNLTRPLVYQVTRSYQESTVSKILDLVESASAKKSSTERFITTFARIYTPIVVILAMLLMTVPLIWAPADYRQWIYRGIVFLLVACPCALHLSVPLSFFNGIGRASKNGILIKGSTYSQTLSQVGIVVFDKTGTLTQGNFKVQNADPKLLLLAGSLEQYSNHPIAKSILAACCDLELMEATVEEIPGLGLKGMINEDEILVGSARLMETFGIQAEENSSKTTVHIAKNRTYLGHLLISDEVKPTAKAAIAQLKNRGIQTVMMTGDRATTAKELGSELGVDLVYADLLPDQKVETLERLYEKYPNQKIAFVGDGINDAPVLTRADIGFAMGGIGSDAAIEAADAVIMNDDLMKLSTAMEISKQTVRTVWQNIYLVMALKIVVLILAVFGMSDILWAVAADTGVTLLAILNSIRKQ